ncbi:MAG: hypothetical protein KKD77_21250, partial [Gammaproteobacteria bacterium]|nr:hypothetical protein [Gammaproteobacteria bacterium]
GQMSGLSVRVGDTIAPAGIYASDHDLFVFMINEGTRVRQPDGKELSRGFFLIHSEVQCRVLGVVTFLYNHVCGNHIVWGAEDVRDHRIVHRGDATKIRDRGLTLLDTVSTHQREESAHEQEAIIQGAWARVLGKDKEEIVTIGQRMSALPKKTVEAAYVQAEQHPEDGHAGPNTAWGMIQGLTRVANDQPYADGAESLNNAASRILKAVS